MPLCRLTMALRGVTTALRRLATGLRGAATALLLCLLPSIPPHFFASAPPARRSTRRKLWPAGRPERFDGKEDEHETPLFQTLDRPFDLRPRDRHGLRARQDIHAPTARAG